MTDDAGRFMAITDAPGCAVVNMNRAAGLSACCTKERRFTSSAIAGTHRRDTRSRMAELAEKPQTAEALGTIALHAVKIARSTDERTAIAAMLPPGVLCGHTISVERTPARRPNAAALSLVGVHEQLSVRLDAAAEGCRACQPVHPRRNCRCRG